MNEKVISPNSLSDTDLFIMVAADNLTKETFIANASACDFYMGRPSIGRI
jgi:hypothetical protein